VYNCYEAGLAGWQPAERGCESVVTTRKMSLCLAVQTTAKMAHFYYTHYGIKPNPDSSYHISYIGSPQNFGSATLRQRCPLKWCHACHSSGGVFCSAKAHGSGACGEASPPSRPQRHHTKLALHTTWPRGTVI